MLSLQRARTASLECRRTLDFVDSIAGEQAVSPELREHLDALEVEGACRAGLAHHGYGDAGGFIFADARASAPERDVLACDGNHGINERFYGHAVHLGIPSLFLEMQARHHGVVLVHAGKPVGKIVAQVLGKFLFKALIVEEGTGKAAVRRGGSESISRSSTNPLRRTLGKTIESKCMSSAGLSGRFDMMSRV